MNRKTLSRREREVIYRRWLLIGVGFVAALIIGVLGFGLLQQFVLAPASPIATVNGKPIRLDTYQRWVRYRRFDMDNYMQSMQAQMSQLDPNDETNKALISYMQQEISQLQVQRANIPTSALDELINDELMRQEAQRRGITVTADEIEKEIQSQFGYDPNPPTPVPTAPVTATQTITGTPQPTGTPVPTPTRMTEEQYKQYYSDYMQAIQKNAGFTEADFRSLAEALVLQGKLQNAMAAEVPTTTEQIHVRQIVVDTEDAAKAALDRIHKGEDFAAVAKDVSTDTATKDKGGDLGWIMRGQQGDQAFDDAAFALQPNQVSNVIQGTYGGYYIIQVLERDANRKMDDTQLSQKQSSALNDWLTQQRSSSAVKRFWSSDKVPADTQPQSRQGS